MKTALELLNEPSEWRKLVYPASGASELLRTGLQKKMKDSLRKVLLETARVMPEKLTNPGQPIAALDISRRFSPRLYFTYFGLLQEMARSDTSSVAQRCDELLECLRAPYADTFEVRDTVDDIAWSFLRAHRAATSSNASVLEVALSTTDGDACDTVDCSAAASARRQLAEMKLAIAACNPNLADEISSLVCVVQLMPRSFSAEAASSLAAFGTVLVRPPSQICEPHERFFYFDRVLHESAHIYLNMLMTFDPLVKNGADPAPSPARQTLRPIKGVLHAHFVFFRLLHAYRYAPGYIRQTEAPAPSPEQLDRLSLSALPLSFATREAVYLDKFMRGDAILRDHAVFTPPGQHFLDSMREAVCHV
jgi:HEXXH motif-containing protein